MSPVGPLDHAENIRSTLVLVTAMRRGDFESLVLGETVGQWLDGKPARRELAPLSVSSYRRQR